ncbi:hypothetical protein RUM43_001246 [Polyplax serrata]|uniref:Sepiapterin reductase n=1 Tax=Polyplax serrata TaxID=468196 RepID=A0AAN8SDR6_POLSC
MVAEESIFLLLARSLNDLNETKALMEAANNKIKIYVHSFNFYNPISGDLEHIMKQSLEFFKKGVKDFDLAMIVHNAGSLGDLTEFTNNMNDLEKLTNYFTLNLFSVCILNTEFLKIFDVEKRQSDLKLESKTCSICILNITSICAIKPFASMGYYCMGKATRETFFSVMAEENKNYIILSYSPGPVLTDMTDEIITNIRNEEMKNTFINLKKDSTILSPEASVSKLVKVLDSMNFVSGGRIDYYDA